MIRLRGVRLSGALLAAGLVSGCATTPNVVYHYYPPQSRSNVTVTQTVDCDQSKTQVIVGNVAVVNTAYSSDYSRGPYSFPIKAVDGALADTDVAFTLYEDGRLKGINESTTGQAETILKAAVNFGAALAPLGGQAPPTGATATLPECAYIDTWGAGKPVTLTYVKNFGYSDATGKLGNLDQPQPKDLYDRIKGKLPLIQLKVDAPVSIESASYAGDASSSDVVLLSLSKMASASVSVLAEGQKFFSSVVIFPTPESFTLPIPKAALFGKNAFSLSVAESGAITSIEYNKTSGAAGVFNVGNAAATAAAPGTTADQAAQAKAQADLIAQQQRLVRCHAKPASCQ